MNPARQLPKSAASTAAAAQDLSVFAVQFVAMELAVLTLAYDGCCRLHSAVDGGLRCCWRSPGGTRFTAMDCTEHGTRAEVRYTLCCRSRCAAAAGACSYTCAVLHLKRMLKVSACMLP
jgi:hypothetical protein